MTTKSVPPVGPVHLIQDDQLARLSRAVLRHGGSVKHSTAENFAKAQYAKFDKARRDLRKFEADKELAKLKEIGEALPRSRKSRNA